MNETTKEQETGVELRMQELLLAYLRRWKLIVVCVILGVAIAMGISFFFITPMYRASITLYISNYRVTEDKDYLTSADLSASIYLVKAYMILAENDTVLEEVATELDEQYSVAQLRAAITTEQIDDTVIFTLHVSHEDPQEAMRIANVLAEVIPVEGPAAIDGTSARTIDTAKVPTAPYSPNYTSNALLGGALGLLLAVIYVTIMCLKDTHIKDENDLTDMFQLPILGRIPDMDSEITGSGYSSTTDSE